MTTLNEQFQNYIDLQKQAFEPARLFGDAAAETFERVVRQNYALVGDYVELLVEQSKLPGEAKDPQEFVGRQVEISRAFGEKLAQRAQEYADIATSAQARAKETVESVGKTVTKSTKKAA